ncbi:GapS1 family protein [Paraburkholderia sp. 22099]|jgi:hypothetical protein|uniref:GapS1 family protein n=1 Tax=Paraburkholderia TaxID=1822464 RepID=UPI0028627693|nr:hypothetical protein [Paraburkholderia terricola]MDR6493514.1 hypothetical protein [Paraburkholderia terricola]
MAKHIPRQKIGIEEAYRSIRNRLRKYSASSIIDAALLILWNPPTDRLKEIRSAPWLTLLIVKWALQDGLVNLRLGPPIPMDEMNRIRQELWDMPETVRDDTAPKNIFLMLRKLMHAQVEFQRPESRGFMRWPALYARIPENRKERGQFRNAFGMEPDVFMVLSFALYAAVLDGNLPLRRDWMLPLRETYGACVDGIYEIFSRNIASLRDELRKDAAQKIHGMAELYEFPYVKRFPLVQLRDGSVHCWHRLVFARGIEEIVHLRLSDLYGEEYTRSFSRVFEDYVTELAIESGVSLMTEAAYKEIAGGHAPAVEAVIDGDGDCNILVEAKMSLFADDVLLQDSSIVAHRKTKRVRDAITQGWKVGGLIRDNPVFGERFQKQQDFLLVVTSRELYVGGGEMLQRLYPADEFGYPDHDAARRLPLSNVFVMGIEEFERVMGCVRIGEVKLPDLLREAALANQDGRTSRMFFSDFLKGYVKEWTLPSILEKAQDQVQEKIRAALSGRE